VQKLLEGAGAEDVEIDFDAKSATCTLPEGMDAKTLAGKVTGRFSATVQQ